MRRRPSANRQPRRSKPDENQTELPLAAMKEQIAAALSASLGAESGTGFQPVKEEQPQAERLGHVVAASSESAPAVHGSPITIHEPPPLMPVRRLQNYAFCPRQFYFQWVEGVFLDNADTVEGSAQHRQVDKPSALPDPL